jgi:hypothetical protein
MGICLGLVRTALSDTDPYLAPLMLAIAGLLACLLAARRWRMPPDAARRLMVGGCLALAVLAFAVGGALLARDAQLFWGARWESDGRTLVLERLGPLPNIRIPRNEVAAITEFSAPEHTLHGRELGVQFIVRTKAGAAHWSAPVHQRRRTDRVREVLIAATNRRLERFWVGGR